MQYRGKSLTDINIPSYTAPHHHSMPAHIVFLSDSRGGGLANFLRTIDGVPPSTTVDVKVIPGATTSKLLSVLRAKSSNINRCFPTHRIIIVLLGGICDFTSKINTRGNEQIVYNPKECPVEGFKGTHSTIIDHCKNRGYFLLTSTIYPADLIKSNQFLIDKGRQSHSTFSQNELGLQQLQLEKDLALTNDFITEKARADSRIFVNLNKYLLSQSKVRSGRSRNKFRKIIKLNYTPLYDGIHPDRSLKEKLFTAIAKSCVLYITPEGKSAPPKKQEADDSQSDQENSWDFKRPRSDSQT